MVLKALELMDNISKELSLRVNEGSRYESIVEQLKLLDNRNIQISDKLRTNIVGYIKLIEVEKERELLLRYGSSYGSMTDYDLIKYFGFIMRTIMWTQNGRLMVVKYSKNIFNTGWHKLAKLCRGKVIDIDTRKIVVYPFDKFFNLNEVDETKVEKIEKLINRANNIYITEKKDGSAIIVTRYKGKLIVNTNGEFDNIQLRLAKKLLISKYSFFYSNVPDGYTIIFELIHPNNRIVIDYGNEEKLYLIAIRDLSTYKLLGYSELKKFADRYRLDIVDSFNYSSLDKFIQKAMEDTSNKMEGWVFRVVGNGFDQMFKLKFAEYFKLSRVKKYLTLHKTYELMVLSQLDDVIGGTNDEIRGIINNHIGIINGIFNSVKDEILEISSNLEAEYGIRIGNLDNKYARMIYDEYKGNEVFTYMMRYLRNGEINDLFDKLPKVSSFYELYKHVMDDKEDRWDEVCALLE